MFCMKGVEFTFTIKFEEKIFEINKKMLAFSIQIQYYIRVRFVGQAVKTPPSHGGNTGSIPQRRKGVDS